MLAIYEHIIKRDELYSDKFLKNPFFRAWMLKALYQFETNMQQDNCFCLFSEKVIKLKQFLLLYGHVTIVTY